MRCAREGTRGHAKEKRRGQRAREKFWPGKGEWLAAGWQHSDALLCELESLLPPFCRMGPVLRA
eukprot:1565435-Pleurochrysis_carterae.AAC.1